MKLKRILSLMLVLIALGMQGQDLKIIVDKKGKVGYADQNGNEVIKCQYEGAQPFSDGVAIVSKSGKSGIIDSKGTVILPLKYSQILPWNKELYLIKDGKKSGLASHQGKIVLPANYTLISKPNCYGKALIALGGKATPNEKKTYMANAKYGIIDSKGNILIKPEYKGLYEFSYDGKDIHPYHEGMRLGFSYHNTVDTLITDCSYVGYSKNGSNIYEAGILDGNGKLLLKEGLYSFVMQPQSGMVRYYTVKKKQTLCGFHNIDSGKAFLAATFDAYFNDINYWTHGDFIGDIAPVNGSSWSFIDKTGKQLRTGYTSLKHSQTAGLWAAKNSSGKWDVFDDSNNDITALLGYSDIEFPKHSGDKEIFSVLKDGMYGCVNRSGDTVVPFEYERVLANGYDVIPVKKDGKWGLLSPNNTCIISPEFEDITLPSERNAKHFWVKKSDLLYYHVNTLTNKISEQGYKTISNFKNGVALVVPSNMKVGDTQVNRAQLVVPNTAKATIDTLTISKYIGSFGYLLNTDDVLLFDIPVSTLYKDKVIEEIQKRGGDALTESEKKNILLNVTRENRSYGLKEILGEEEWNY